MKTSIWPMVCCIAILAGSGCATKGTPLTAANKTTKKSTADPDLQFSMGRVREQEGNLPKALEIYQGLYAKNPNSAEVCHRLGVVKLRMGEPDEGVTYLMEADALDPRNQEVKSDLGYAYVLQGEYEIAERFLREAININPSDARSVNNLAMAVGYQGRFDESLSLYRGVSSAAAAHANIGYIHSQMGNAELAAKHYSKALDYNPDLKSAAEALIQLNEINTQVASLKSDNDRIQLTTGTVK